MKLRLTTNTICAFLLIIFLAVGLLVTQMGSRSSTDKEPGLVALNKSHISMIQVDSFKNFLNKVYANTLSIGGEKDKLSIEITQQGKLANDFINSNERLLETNEFCDIKIDQEQGIIKASFPTLNINEETFVKVPNDVLIGITAKK